MVVVVSAVAVGGRLAVGVGGSVGGGVGCGVGAGVGSGVGTSTQVPGLAPTR